MRTNIVMDDQLMREILKAVGLRSKKEAVEPGLRTLLRLQQQRDIRRLRGTMTWEGDLEKMRANK